MAHIIDRTDQLLARMRRIQRVAVTALAVEYTNEVTRLLNQPGTGRVYRRLRARGRRKLAMGKRRSGGDYITHQASAPGEPPAPDRGVLRGSVTFALTLGMRGWEATCGSSEAIVPAALEFGTPTIRPRPAWRPAFLTILARGRQIVKTATGTEATVG